MRCPVCGRKLYEINPPGGEWVCCKECPANQNNGCCALTEYYGTTQKEINKQKI
jgi:hypothetical protein